MIRPWKEINTFSTALLVAYAEDSPPRIPFNVAEMESVVPADVFVAMKRLESRIPDAGDLAMWGGVIHDMSHNQHRESCQKIVAAAGFDLWDTGGGCTAWGLSIHDDKDDVILITLDDGIRCYGDPNRSIWYIERSRDGDPMRYDNPGPHTLPNALVHAAILAQRPFRAGRAKRWTR